MSADDRLHTLVVDDSAVIRQAVAAILGEAGLSVDTAADPLIALAKMERNRPDVILLDLEMPRMDGLTFLRRLMREHPLPVVVLSSHAARGTETALQALEEGAVEVLAKPGLGIRDFLDRSASHLVDVVRAAGRARLPARIVTARGGMEDAPPQRRPAGRHPSHAGGDGGAADGARVVALAASTGGPETLRRILAPLPVELPGLVIVQHMPRAFTAAFARRLDESCDLDVREAEDGDPVAPGTALVAPGGRHLEVARAGDRLRIHLHDDPPVGRHRPSADVLFHSVARAAGAAAVGVILTGMGGDGAEGLLALRRAGAATLALDEASCVVYGMPARAVALGAVERVVSLTNMPGALLARARRPAPEPTRTRTAASVQ